VLVDFLFDPGDPMLTSIDRLWELALLHQSLGVPTSEGMASSLQRGKGKKFHIAPRQLMSCAIYAWSARYLRRWELIV
jgi:hypothetical protein